jgi:hypothetical protein
MSLPFRRDAGPCKADFVILETDDVEGMMSRVAYLKLAYAVAYAFWLMYVIDKFYVLQIAAHNRVAVACLLLFGLPPALGYILLFHVFPRAGRLLIRKS